MARLYAQPPYPLTADEAALLATTRRPVPTHASYSACWRALIASAKTYVLGGRQQPVTGIAVANGQNGMGTKDQDVLDPAMSRQRALARLGAATET